MGLLLNSLAGIGHSEEALPPSFIHRIGAFHLSTHGFVVMGVLGTALILAPLALELIYRAVAARQLARPLRTGIVPLEEWLKLRAFRPVGAAEQSA